LSAKATSGTIIQTISVSLVITERLAPRPAPVVGPTPVISNVSVVSVAGNALTFTVDGSGFVPASVVKLNGTVLSTRYNSSSKLVATGSSGGTATALSLAVMNPDGQMSGAVLAANPAPRSPRGN